MTKLLYYMKCQRRKREIIQSNIYRIVSNFNQVIYTLYKMCMPNFMILSQAVLQIFCWQGLLWVKCVSRKWGIIQSNIHRILRNVNQVIYTMYLNCMIDTNEKSDGKEKIQILLFFILIPHIKFQDPISNRSWPHAKCDPRTDGRTDGQAQTNMPPQLLRSWGHKKVYWG